MIILGIGSSIEPKEFYLKKALEELGNHNNIKIKAVSKIYKTSAWGGVAKNTFLNNCVEIDFTASPDELLEIIKEIESKLGRVRKEYLGDRTIDIDILLFNDIKLSNDVLKIPHPFIKKRNFVLLPMLDICGDILIENKKISYWLEQIKDNIEIYR
ncbi:MULTISPECIES: 2-amino-4-hydroxy-6-hydroxymethyldihydropteridine diphosphokinase [unclassified Gemella]|uniref:2-amino-4-hydroxy-6- hydroxymethyldihydropteridine diphosphokinase n=1 Tax=unclassified Gemella TaxID=2624949 RepID=UPI001C04FAC6|nr:MULTISPECIES: 2-amino-4-hydroxy-6-hydroxymethyldihydropteridine diphosphokinase [unclassified Gemella]MBU0278082.1 2-amino-4-hydroxy-6-hydroxymethyldihydropteridine diphosphokinase [Gemella sp. zg-1178]QWQ38391.1 2-amino-4-hydroxy-6-hydroxymethyldihydropteridine diphosphokinase [Gemella sp. zg-570]